MTHFAVFLSVSYNDDGVMKPDTMVWLPLFTLQLSLVTPGVLRYEHMETHDQCRQVPGKPAGIGL